MAFKKEDKATLAKESENRTGPVFTPPVEPEPIKTEKRSPGRPEKQIKNETLLKTLIPREIAHKFEKYCAQQGDTVSGKLREILYKYLEEKGLK